MSDYRVNLDIYNGPMDLLLYLIRRDEVDIYDIPIANITEQYVKYVDLLEGVDPNLAGDFLVLAATLMEIKTRMLLPTPEALDAGEEGQPLDPRAELVRQLLEYKAFKDASEDLRILAEQQAMKFPRQPVKFKSFENDEVDIEDVQVWDLFDAFSKIMESIGQRPAQHEVIYDDTPLELHATDILDRLEREGPITFQRVFAGRTKRAEIVGLFLAVLELVKQKKIFASQGDNFGEIHIHINPNPPTAEELENEKPLDYEQYISAPKKHKRKSGEDEEPKTEQQEYDTVDDEFYDSDEDGAESDDEDEFEDDEFDNDDEEFDDDEDEFDEDDDDGLD